MHINLKTILSVLFRMQAFSGRSKRLLTICMLSATIQITTLRKSPLTSETSQLTYRVSILGKQ